MGISDRLKQLTKRAEDTAAEHKDQIKEAVEKAEVTADQRSGGRYHEQIAGAAAKAQAYVDKLEPDATDKPSPAATEPPSPDAQRADADKPSADAQPAGGEPPAGAAG